MLIYTSEFLLRKVQGHGWNIARVCVALFYIAFLVITQQLDTFTICKISLFAQGRMEA